MEHPLNTSDSLASLHDRVDGLRAGSVGTELRALREMRGMSQKELAARTGIKPGQVSQMETGKYHPSLVMLTRILDALDARIAIELNEGGLLDPSGSEEPPARKAP